MHSKDNWDDLRFVLAVAEVGSVSAAARALGVNHATVLRRVAAFEDRFGVEIFEKSAKGYAILEDRLQVIAAVRDVEHAMESVARAVEGTQVPLRGDVRVTSTDTFCHAILPRAIAEMQESAAELRIELISTNTHLDLGRLRADIAVRPTVALADDLEGEVAAELGFDLYARPETPMDKWLAITGATGRSRVAKWMSENIEPNAFTAAADSFISLRDLAAAGLGQAILPCILADSDPRLERRRGIIPELPVAIWVASHSEFKDLPRIRAVRQMLVASLSARRDEFAGLV